MDRIGISIGGDEAYIEGSILAQACRIYNLNYIVIKSDVIKREHTMAYKLVDNEIYAGPQLNEIDQIQKHLTTQEINEESSLLYDRCIGKSDANYMRPRNFDNKQKINGINFESVFPNSVVVYLHDFIDSPGIYGSNLFNDQYEWLNRIYKLWITEGSGNLIFKLHPNFSSINKKIIDTIINAGDFEKVIWTSDDFTISNLKEFGCNAVLTMFGSVIFEATFFSIPVISCANYPGRGYNLSKECNTLDEFDRYLIDAFNGNLLVTADPQSASKVSLSLKKHGYNYRLYSGPYDDFRREQWKSIFDSRFDPDFNIGWEERKKYSDYSRRAFSYVKSLIELERETIMLKLKETLAN
jgi:hypothetical protein